MNKKTLVAMAKRLYSIIRSPEVTSGEIASAVSMLTYADIEVSITCNRSAVRVKDKKYVVTVDYDEQFNVRCTVLNNI